MQLFAKFKKIMQRGFRATLRVSLPGHVIAMVTYCATELTATYSPLIVQFVDTMMLV